ncbi:MAG: hypothetical protein PUG04_07650 [Lachnospiraceae bacterium]|nr:hypothetical protein [Lachnospiraceae bacterium]
MKYRKKAFYTLEATWMFGLALVIFIGVILLTIHLYGETYEDIADRQPEEIHAVPEFRKIQMYRNLIEQKSNGDNVKEE